MAHNFNMLYKKNSQFTQINTSNLDKEATKLYELNEIQNNKAIVSLYL